MILLDAGIFDYNQYPQAPESLNDSSGVEAALKMVFGCMKSFVSFLQNIKIAGDVSLFHFLIGVAILSIVIVYLINIAKRPTVETTSQAQRRRGKE